MGVAGVVTEALVVVVKLLKAFLAESVSVGCSGWWCHCDHTMCFLTLQCFRSVIVITSRKL